MKLAPTCVFRYWQRRLKPQVEAEAEAFRLARAQTKALLEEIKADPSIEATEIAEVLLVNQIIKDRLKLGEVDIMRLYREQRERVALDHEAEKIELQRKALELKSGNRARPAPALLAPPPPADSPPK